MGRDGAGTGYGIQGKKMSPRRSEECNVALVRVWGEKKTAARKRQRNEIATAEGNTARTETKLAQRCDELGKNVPDRILRRGDVGAMI